MPSLIELDCNVNASAGLRRGFKSFFGNDLILTLGLPFVAGLTVREFAGLVAHELGHCTQGAAMRLRYIILRIENWFGRVVFERDSWDDWLEDWAGEAEGFTAWVVGFASLGVWFSRKILFLLLLVGHAFTCFLSRRMEFHADQFEIRLAGSASFESTNERQGILTDLYHNGLMEMELQWRKSKRLPDNLPQFMLNLEKTMRGSAYKKQFNQRLGFVKTGLFHTHPSDADRVRRARQAAAPGIVVVDAPASALFSNFAAASRIVTRLFYEGIGLPLFQAKIYEVEGADPIEAKEEATDTPDSLAIAAVKRFCFDVVSPLRPIFPKLPEKPADDQVAAALSAIAALPSQMSAIAEPVGAACAQFEEADAALLSAAQTGGDAAAALENREQSRRALESVLEACEQRLANALGLSRADQFARQTTNAQSIRQRALDGARELAAFKPLLNSIDQLRINTAKLAESSDPNLGVANQIKETIIDVEASLRDIPSPWRGPKGNLSLSQYYKTTTVSQQVYLLDGSIAFAGFVHNAYRRKLGDLILLAEEIVQIASGPVSDAVAPVPTATRLTIAR